MGNRAFKDHLYAEFGLVGKALASPHRLELLDLLAQGERSVEELAQEAGLNLANASAHLQALRRARLVEADKRGLRVYYRLAGPEVFALWRALRDVGSTRLAEVDRLVETYLADRSTLEAVSMPELLRHLDEEGVVVIDVRPPVEFRQGHIAGARSIPLAELRRRLAELPKDRDIVAYCRGPYCVYADEAVSLLAEEGYRVRRLEGGYPDWRADGYPVEAETLAS
jgi:rhodanese-related sulfurtransferase